MKFKRSSLSISILITLFCIVNISRANPEENSVYRVMFDVGSSTTKVKAALVNTSTKKIIQTFDIEEDELPVPYRKDIPDCRDNPSIETCTFSQDIRNEGVRIINHLKGIALNVIPRGVQVDYRAVATSAFRLAYKGHPDGLKSFLKRIKRDTGVTVTVISQQREAELGFWAVANHVDTPVEDLVVWNIGGSSMQIITFKESAEDRAEPFDFFLTEALASVPAEEFIIRFLHGEAVTEKATPNPILYGNCEIFVDYCRAFAKNKVSQSIIKKIEKGTSVFGIGGVHYYSIPEQVNNGTKTYTMGEVEDQLNGRVKLTDDELAYRNNPKLQDIPDPEELSRKLKKAKTFISGSVSNLALVLGFMRGMGIDSITSLKINMADGILLDGRLWTLPEGTDYWD